MAEQLGLTLIGIFVISMGYRVGWKGEIATVHRYHYTNVSEQNMPRFCRTLGIWEMIVGAGCLVMPWLNLATRAEVGYWIGLVAILIGCGGLIATILKYNGRLF